MKGKTLKNKINDIVFVICAGGVLYLIVGFLMKTNWLSCPKPLTDLYEIVRDTLTLMAYFLAPAIALVLFSDWRQEHVEKNREQQGKEIYNLVKQVDSSLKHLELEVEDEDNFVNDLAPRVDEVAKELIKHLSAIQNNLNEFSFDDEHAIAFKEKVYEILDEFRESYFLLTRIFSVLVKTHNPSKYNTEYEGEDNNSFVDRQKRMYEEFHRMYIDNFGNNYKHMNELKLIYDELKVKAASPN